MMSNRPVPVIHHGRAALLAFTVALALVGLILLAGCVTNQKRTQAVAPDRALTPFLTVESILDRDAAFVIATPHLPPLNWPRFRGRYHEMPLWTFRLLIPQHESVPDWLVHEICHIVMIAQGFGFGETACDVKGP